MWIDNDSHLLPSGVEEQLKAAALIRTDKTDRVWLNLETGAFVILASDGGWRNPAESSFKVFHRSPTGELFEITHGMLSNSNTRFDSSKTGSDTYRDVAMFLAEKISRRLGVQVLT